MMEYPKEFVITSFQFHSIPTFANSNMLTSFNALPDDFQVGQWQCLFRKVWGNIFFLKKTFHGT